MIPNRLLNSFLMFVLLFVFSSISTSAQSPSVTVRLESNGTGCGRDVYFSLRGFAPNSPITNSSSSTERNCNGDIIPSGWSGWAIGNTDGNGNKEFSVTHGAYGNYTYTFTDASGNSASVSFNYEGNSNPPPQEPEPSQPQPSAPQEPAPSEPEQAQDPICPSGTGPGGITAGNYDPITLTQEQRDWLWQVFEGEAPPAPQGYGGKTCISSSGDNPQNDDNSDQEPDPPTSPLVYGSPNPVGERSVRIIAERGLNIRSGPGTNHTIIGRAVYNGWFEVVFGPESGWYFIQFGARQGWVSAGYVEYFDSSSESPQPTSENCYALARIRYLDNPETLIQHQWVLRVSLEGESVYQRLEQGFSVYYRGDNVTEDIGDLNLVGPPGEDYVEYWVSSQWALANGMLEMQNRGPYYWSVIYSC